MSFNSLCGCLFAVSSVTAFQFSSSNANSYRSHRFAHKLDMKTEKISVMVNGMPGPMAVEVAKACLDRGYNLLPLGFTGPNQPTHLTVTGANSFVDVELVAGPGISDTAGKALSILKEMHPNLIIVDYTHPSAILNNLACYVENDCDFVMGTTGGDPKKMMEIFNKGKNKAVIAPNMAKQIVALQAALQEMATRFPKSFADYKLTVLKLFRSYRHFLLNSLSMIPFQSFSCTHTRVLVCMTVDSDVSNLLFAGYGVTPVFQS